MRRCVAGRLCTGYFSAVTLIGACRSPHNSQFRHTKLPTQDLGGVCSISQEVVGNDVTKTFEVEQGTIATTECAQHTGNSEDGVLGCICLSASRGPVNTCSLNLLQGNDIPIKSSHQDFSWMTGGADQVFTKETLGGCQSFVSEYASFCVTGDIPQVGGMSPSVQNMHPGLLSTVSPSRVPAAEPSLMMNNRVTSSSSNCLSVNQHGCQGCGTCGVEPPEGVGGKEGPLTCSSCDGCSPFRRGEQEIDRSSTDNEGCGEATFVVRDHMRNTVPVKRLLSFKELVSQMPPWVRLGLERSGYTAPSVVQSVAIPLFMERHDVVGVAPTGSGKTVAFVLPALAVLAKEQSGRNVGNSTREGRVNGDTSGTVGRVQATPHVLVLCPTRELVQQTRRVFSLLSEGAVRIAGVYGGQDREQQLKYVRNMGGCDVLVATPGRLCDFVEAQEISLKMVDFLIVDEADRMLELGFAPQLEFLMSDLRKYRRDRQTTMWTATWNATVSGLAMRFMRPERLLLEVDREHKVNSDISQKMYALSDPSQRLQAIVKLYNDGVINRKQQVLVFVNRKDEVEWLAGELTKALRAPTDMLKFLHGGMRQNRREAISRGFNCNEVRVLCATDIAARGIDVPGLAHVINYDIPSHVDAYVHRIGRTGRAGRAGVAHTFITAGDPNAPTIARFIVQQQRGATMPDDILSIIQDVERRGPTPSRQRYKQHSSVVGKDWRVPAHGERPPTHNSRYVRGVGVVTTLKRPEPRR